MEPDEELESGQTTEPSETSAPEANETPPESLEDAISSALGVQDEAGEPDDQDDPAASGDSGARSGDNAEQGADDQEFLTPPDGINGRAKRRFDDLAARYKERDEQYTQLEAQARALQERYQAFAQEVQSTRASPEKFSAGLEYMRIVNDPHAPVERLRAAKQLIESELAGINRRLGETSSPSEAEQLINQYPDLRQAVDDMRIDEQYAAQIAGQRAREQYAAQARQAERAQWQTQHEQQTQIQAATQQGAAAVQSWVNQALASDPNARQIIESIKPVLMDLARVAPPSAWVQVADSAYRAQRAALQAAAPPPSRHEQPLSGASRSAGRSAPKSLQDALMQQFELE